MFKRYECLCIGFVTHGMDDPEAKRVMCIRPCNRHRGEIYREYQLEPMHSLAKQPSTKLTDGEIEDLLSDLGDLVRDGYALRELRRAMRAAGVAP